VFDVFTEWLALGPLGIYAIVAFSLWLLWMAGVIVLSIVLMINILRRRNSTRDVSM